MRIAQLYDYRDPAGNDTNADTSGPTGGDAASASATASASSSGGGEPGANQPPPDSGEDIPSEGGEHLPPEGASPIYVGDDRLWPDELADLIAESDLWLGGPIRLLVADGVLDDEFLRRLADLLGVAILVPADDVIDDFHRCSSGTVSVYNEPEPVTPPDDGQWRVFEPRTARSSISMETQ